MQRINVPKRQIEALNLWRKNGFEIIELIRLCNSGLNRFHIKDVLDSEEPIVCNKEG